MEVMELAAELGKKIKEDPRIVAMKAAEAAYENDRELQKLLIEYNAQSTALTEEYKKSEHDAEFIKLIEKRINELYHEITENPNMIAYQKSQEVVNAFMNEVNGEITYQITGERPCTHDCSSCHANCGHNH
ncbi:MAG: YlbF family regulator [Ruminococcaceae bacterium]|nr:YlbF family regulator [Oscillospiraceae bacterium]